MDKVVLDEFAFLSIAILIFGMAFWVGFIVGFGAVERMRPLPKKIRKKNKN